MASLQLATSFDQPRPMSQQAFHHSPAESPRLARPASQASFHHAPVSATYTPTLPTHSESNGPLTAFPGQFRPFTPSAMTLPIPNQPNYNTYPPPSAPLLSYFPHYSQGQGQGNGQGHGNGQDMTRTYSHAHPMHSATDRTASTRYSPSPHSAGGIVQHQESPPSATIHHSTYNMSSIQPQPTIQVSDTNQGRGHINPSLFNNNQQQYSGNGNNYPMSRSTSGASASDAGNEMGRLLTPHYQFEHRDHLSPHDDMRKVSDSIMNLGMSKNRLYPASYAPAYESNGGHGLGLGPHPQPSELYFRGNQYGAGMGEHYALSSARGDVKPDLGMMDETDYERERQQQILSNRRLMEDVGLGQQNYRQREPSGAGHRRKNKTKRQSSYQGPVRQSGRIASVGRTSYADLDEADERGNSSDEYDSDGDDAYEEDVYRPSKKARGRVTYTQKSHSTKNRRQPQVELSLWGLLQVYPEIPHLFPLFYYTLNNDLTINSESVPLIGSIPSTVTPVEKADNLKMYFHRGRRVLAQLDTFAARCDRKYDGPEDKWPEMDYHTRIAVRDVRRKVVERCENYKYTRRDILDKAMGKGKWPAIEIDMIEWIPSTGNNDPANDLANVTLTLPTPPPSAYHQQHQQPRMPLQTQSSRQIRAFPQRRYTSNSNSNPNSNRVMSVTSASPLYAQQPHTASGTYYNPSSSTMPQSAPPMYGEDEVPMSVQLQPHSHSSQGHQISSGTATPLQMITHMPQVPGGSGSWDFPSQPHVHAQQQQQGQVMQAMTPVPTGNVDIGGDHVDGGEEQGRGTKRSRSESEDIESEEE